MQKKRYGLIVLFMLICSVTSAQAEVSVSIGLPNLSIGINLPLFPELVPVPGYPVYYAPRVDANYFFYDGMYWVYQDDNWYASSWYNGPWGLVDPEVVPLFILRVPVRYYRQPPVYFRGWHSNAPPRWGQHWGHGWEQRRAGWDRWNRGSAPTRAPLPVYQRQYTRDRYPRQVEQQHMLRSQRYRYQPHDRVIRQHFQRQPEHGTPPPAQRGRPDRPEMRSPRQPEIQHPAPHQQGPPAGQRPQPEHRGGDDRQRSVPVQAPSHQRGPAVHEQGQQPVAVPREQRQLRGPASHDQRQQPGDVQRERQEQRSHERGESREPRRDQGHGQNRDEGRGRDRDRNN